MKKKSTSQSAPVRRSLGEGGFINLRALLALTPLSRPAWPLQYSRAGTSQCDLPLSPIATCLYRATNQRVKLLVWHNWNNTGMTV